MKTVVLTISRGSIARNILQNDFYRLLREKYRVLLVTPAFEDPRFLKEFAHANVEMFDQEVLDRGPLDLILFFFHKYLIYNSTVNQKARWGIIGDPKSMRVFYPIYFIKKVIFSVLSRVTILRDFVRVLDFYFAQRPAVSHWQHFLREQKADMVIVTNMGDDAEAALLKAARRERVYSLAMPKSWDNPNKNGFRAKADMVIVWNTLMAEEMKKFQNYSDAQISIIGVPQFDYYIDSTRLQTREAFCAAYGLDPKKKILLFTSEGKLFKEDSELSSVIYTAIEKGLLEQPCQLLIRPHYGFKQDEQKFKHLFGKPDVVVDLQNEPSRAFRDEWDYSTASMDRFLNTIYHTDIDINVHSSLTLDVLPFDTPVISIMFDGYIQKPYRSSIRRWYETYYYSKILSFKATTEVQNKEMLYNAINQYLTDATYKSTERKHLLETFCYKYDGRSGERFFSVVEKILNN